MTVIINKTSSSHWGCPSKLCPSVMRLSFDVEPYDHKKMKPSHVAQPSKQYRYTISMPSLTLRLPDSFTSRPPSSSSSSSSSRLFQAPTRTRKQLPTFSVSSRTWTRGRTPRRFTPTSPAPQTPRMCSLCLTPSPTSSSRTTWKTVVSSEDDDKRRGELLFLVRSSSSWLSSLPNLSNNQSSPLRF